MKKICLTALVAFLVFSLASSVNAQNYQSAIGARLGYPLSASYKFSATDNGAIEAFASFRRFGVFDYSFTRLGVGGTYQIHNDIPNAENLQWYYGGGAGIYFHSYSNATYFEGESSTAIALHGSIGLDYRFQDVPINLSLDWQPTFFLTGYKNGFAPAGGALSVRYILGE